MKHLIRLTELNKQDIYRIFSIADEIQNNKYSDALKGKTVVMFFPSSSVRTRLAFEKGVYLLGGQVVLFPTETLDKKEDIRDVCGYLNNWADVVIVRHKNIELLEAMSKYSSVPIINAMTDCNHPCEILSDLYALSKMCRNFEEDKFLFCGKNGNIGLGWKEAADVLGIDLSQCCKMGDEIKGVPIFHDIKAAICGKDIICTDTFPHDWLNELSKYQITMDIMKLANDEAILNPCPPFYRGEEVTDDVIESEFFVGYNFKKYLLYVQQAIILFLLSE